MKIHIEESEDLKEDEITIRCKKVDQKILNIKEYILEQSSLKETMIFYKEQKEYQFALETILFFETLGDKIYAHTKNEAYTINYKLYELENILPRNFIRVSKGTIINIMPIFSIQRNLTSSSLVEFIDTYKKVYVSRHYYKEFRKRLTERRYYET